MRPSKWGSTRFQCTLYLRLEWLPASNNNHPDAHVNFQHKRHVIRRSLASKDQSSSASPEPEQQTTSFLAYSIDFWPFISAEIMRNCILQGVLSSLAGQVNATHLLLANSSPILSLKRQSRDDKALQVTRKNPIGK